MKRSRGMLAIAASARSSAIAGRSACASSRAWRGDIQPERMRSIARQHRDVTSLPQTQLLGVGVEPLVDELLGVEADQVGAQLLEQLGRLLGRQVPDTASTSPSSTETTSIRSSRLGSARNAGSRPPRETISSIGAVGLHGDVRAPARPSPRATRVDPANSALADLDRRQRPSRRRRARARGPLRPARRVDAQPDPLEHRGRVHLAGGRGDQHRVLVAEVAPAGERLAERRQRERHRAPDRLA